MNIRRCMDCKNIKYLVNDTGVCPSCIRENISETEYNILHYLYKSNGVRTNVTKLQSVLSKNDLGPEIHESKIHKEYGLVNMNRSNTYRGVEKIEVELTDQEPIEQIIE